ncbi:MAG: hypothetical protein MZV64_13560 [Ignavibacteriales bacterium]|nr:hypothetical protein [Ignavibacteriales bacterium]
MVRPRREHASAMPPPAGARRRPAAPLVLNPQGLEEFGGIDGSYGGRPSKRLAYEPLRRAVRYCAAPPIASSPPTGRSSRCIARALRRRRGPDAAGAERRRPACLRHPGVAGRRRAAARSRPGSAPTTWCC